MTYGDIIEWIEENYEFEAGEDANEAFETISNDWKQENRDTLKNTLGVETENFIDRIRDLIPEVSKKEPEFVLNDTLQGIVNFFKGLFR